MLATVLSEGVYVSSGGQRKLPKEVMAELRSKGCIGGGGEREGGFRQIEKQA